ncbi:MAG: hypothetical protein KDC92_03735 [Bacteroidetes bacterium]|nr:hypothetical protein [Bacteroidota bacterium]
MAISISFLHKYAAHTEPLYALSQFDDNHFISGGGDKKLIKWKTGNTETAQLLASTTATIYFCQLFNNQLIIGDNSGGVYIIDDETKSVLFEINLGRTTFQILTANNCHHVLCADGFLYKLSNKLQPLNSWRLGQSHLRYGTQTSSNKLLIGTSGGELLVFDLKTEILTNSQKCHADSVFSVYHKNGIVITGGKDAYLRNWKMDSSGVLQPINEVPAHLFTVNHIISLGDTGLIATASRDKTIKIWDSETLLLRKVIDLAKFPEAHSHSVNRLLFNPKTKRLLSAGDDRIIREWQLGFD